MIRIGAAACVAVLTAAPAYAQQVSQPDQQTKLPSAAVSPFQAPNSTNPPVPRYQARPFRTIASDPSTSIPQAAPAAVPAPIETPTARTITPPEVHGLPVTPHLAFDPASDIVVRDLHLRPLFTTTVHLPENVTSIAVGAPTLFEVEHKDSEPALLFVKPSTHAPAESNLLIALESGQTISIRLISPGDAGSQDPTDFVVDFRGPKSLFNTTGNSVGTPANAALTPARKKTSVSMSSDGSEAEPDLNVAAAALGNQSAVGAPRWVTAPELTKIIKANALAPNNVAIAIGEIRQEGEQMTVSFSVLNISEHWISLMPPQIELVKPLLKKRQAKKQGSFAEPVPAISSKLDNPKLSPGARSDGSITFNKPDFKIAKEMLMLHIATSAAIDTPVYYPLPFVAPSSAETIQEADRASN